MSLLNPYNKSYSQIENGPTTELDEFPTEVSGSFTNLTNAGRRKSFKTQSSSSQVPQNNEESPTSMKSAECISLIHKENNITEAASNIKRLKFVLMICFGAFLIQLIGGIMSRSLAIIADSFHLLTGITSPPVL